MLRPAGAGVERAGGGAVKENKYIAREQDQIKYRTKTQVVRRGSQLRNYKKEGLTLARLLMVLASFSPLFLLWAIRGTTLLNNSAFALLCATLIILPNTFLLWQIKKAQSNKDIKTISIEFAEDHREHVIVYLFAILFPVYSLSLDTFRNLLSAVVALTLILVIFWCLNLHYINIFFSLFGYNLFTLIPPQRNDGISGEERLILITPRTFIRKNEQIDAVRISDTVFFESKKE